MHQVDALARDALRNAVVDGTTVHIREQLAESVWASVSKVLTMLGGKYRTNRSAFAFPHDPRPAIDKVVETGECMTVAQSDGYVPTPKVLAEELTTSPYSDLARMPAGSRVLEPSAGDGAIVRAILEANAEVEVVAVEPNVQRFPHLPHEGQHGGRVTALRMTFEEYAAGPGAGQRFDAVIMNPPFSVPGKASLWIDHVMLAWNMLEPGGRMVAVVPDGFLFRSDRRHGDMRRLVDDYGGWVSLPDDTFGGPKTCAIWMSRPIPNQEGRPPWLFRHYPEAIEPVPVRTPWLTARAVREAPVQVWSDGWTNQDRVLRYRAQCWRCGWLLWEFDGANDMALGQHAATSSLDAAEHDMIGPSVGMCLVCEHDSRETADKALDIAVRQWRKTPTKAAATSVWSALLNRGGMIPVDAVERERYARVQAALRVVFGVAEQAPEAELIEAREAKPWRGGPDRLAARYLQAYADRLDPGGDLDDADRAALLWRTDAAAPPVALAEEPDPWGEVLTQLELDLRAPV
jgi:hypothetical protein